MKTKMKLLIMIFMSVFIMTGCGEKEELETIPQVSLEDIINTDEEVDEEGCPEGYVYDYQVSMEPIPEEIAALGGEVCGTIHAYPTKIKIALAKQEIERDAKLKAQNEKNIEGVKKYLEETYNGEFEIEPLSTGIWSYMCTELSTGKGFPIYISSLYIMGVSDAIVDLDTYFYEENAQKNNNDINTTLKENIQDDFVFRTRLESVENVDILYIKIAIFKESEINYIDEQKMIIALFEKMEGIEAVNGREIRLSINITYFSPIYKDVIKKQYQSNNILDMSSIYNKSADKLLEEREILGQFEYYESNISEDENDLKAALDNKESYLNNKYILPYWRGLE